ncbi:hypothetical protein KTO58_05875 [Chitinophaga pendula]|uniref:glucoamylase family protein n=1 Tax=Chitinophaga TaxID=79328 RepID=UPI000BAF31DA|nr:MULTISPECIES: glucoamylase family protein [Chitinophaga]ASZ13660.1 hypothetical protein CK934_23250 [Chitinophaga sp. MD30]UCJ08715.1 hypothetical protein KTO58_05875 [Chitinophaga pendula]
MNKAYSRQVSSFLPHEDILTQFEHEPPPFRSELFDAEQMLQYCRQLAGRHKLIAGLDNKIMFRSLSDNKEKINRIHKVLAEAGSGDDAIELHEWRTNFYLIEDQLSKAKMLLTAANKKLPRLQGESGKDYPRIYRIITAFIAHSNAQVDINNLLAFVNTYQTISPLQTGELRAIQLVLKVALIENLVRVAARIAVAKINQGIADSWAARIATANENGIEALNTLWIDFLLSGHAYKDVVIAEVIRYLQEKSPKAAIPMSRLEQILSEKSLTGKSVMVLVNEELTMEKVSFRNCLSSIRMLDTVDWSSFIDAANTIDPILSKEHSGVYPLMEFHTRDRYRREVGAIARQANVAETVIADHVRRLADNAHIAGDTAYGRSHVGYFLIGEGRKQLAEMLGIPWSKKSPQPIGRKALILYLGGFLLFTALLSAVFFNQLQHEARSLMVWLLMSVAIISGAGQLAKLLVDMVASCFTKPVLLPRLDYANGIPDSAKTLVVVPALLFKEEDVKELVHALEVRYLANRTPNLYFGLVTDFSDASDEIMPGDDQILELLADGITALNDKYNSAGDDLFFLFHRPRCWNPLEKIWMGYERKRGKLMGLTALLRGEANEFSRVIGDTTLFAGIRYVITLDADTQLPRDAAWKMTGTMAHPLNHPEYCEKRLRVIAGYGMLQPRMANDLREMNQSRYHRFSGSGPDLDPYTRAIPDLYQDLFGEGSFVGKGIYDVDIVLKALHNRFPDDRVLSHDLLEGSYVRSGLLNDVKLYEQVTGYNAEIKRKHRWIRGDWQIASWIGPFVPTQDNRKVNNPISALSRWKMLDNLRISLMPVGNLLLLVLGMTVLSNTLFWTMAGILTMMSPALITLISKLFSKPVRLLTAEHWMACIKDTAADFLLRIYEILVLPYEAYLAIDAILRAVWRVYVSKRRLLEWVPSANFKNIGNADLLTTCKNMLVGPALSVFVVAYWILTGKDISFMPVVLLAGWLLSPVCAWWMNHPDDITLDQITREQTLFLHQQARKIWAYFETFINESGNWLPPDHFQEHPVKVLKDYTSPTNMGLALLANLTAHDFGYLTSDRIVVQLNNILHAMGRLERYKGHFYNWYNIHSLSPCYPRYVSTVDSGNLAGHLMTLRQGITDVNDSPLISITQFKGLLDTALVLETTMTGTQTLQSFIQQLHAITKEELSSLEQINVHLSACIDAVNDLGSSLRREYDKDSDAVFWIGRLEDQCDAMQSVLDNYFPWVSWTDLPASWQELLPSQALSPQGLKKCNSTIKEAINQLDHPTLTHQERAVLHRLANAWEKTEITASHLLQEVAYIRVKCTAFADMDYDFLYNKENMLLSIGYQMETESLDPDYYDELASEARLASYAAICQGKIPVKNWFALGRPLVQTDEGLVMLSANGTMFEYLMPLLVMPDFDNTLLNQACKAAVTAQIAYGNKKGIPWGFSESEYYALDANSNYQYKVFGAPDLSLRQSYLSEDSVVAPYASAMALMVSPAAACRNLELLAKQQFSGRYGFFEAIDYTRSRVPGGQQFGLVRSYMVHHQGMALLGMAYLLQDKPMQRRFMQDPELESSILLLQEKFPLDVPFHIKGTSTDNPGEHEETGLSMSDNDWIKYPAANGEEEVQLLSNGRYHTILSNKGKYLSRWKNASVSSWTKPAIYPSGLRCYVYDPAGEQYCTSLNYYTGEPQEQGKMGFSAGSAVCYHESNGLHIREELSIAPDDDMEVRRISVYNDTNKKKEIEIISYATAALDNSFVAIPVPILPDGQVVLFVKNAKHDNTSQVCLFHTTVVESGTVLSEEYIATADGGKGEEHKHTQMPGQENNPLLAAGIRNKILVAPKETVIVNVLMGVGETKEQSIDIVRKMQQQQGISAVITDARRHALMVKKRVNLTDANARLFRRLAGSTIFSTPVADNTRTDLRDVAEKPATLLLKIKSTAHSDVILQIVQLHAYWRMHGIITDLVIWNEDTSCYRHFLQKLIFEIINNGVSAELLNRHGGGIFIRMVAEYNEEEKRLLQDAVGIIVAKNWNTSFHLSKWNSNINEKIVTA